MAKKFAEDFSGWVRSRSSTKSELFNRTKKMPVILRVFRRIKITFLIQDDFSFTLTQWDFATATGVRAFIQGYHVNKQTMGVTDMPVVLTGGGWKKDFSGVFLGVPVDDESPVFCLTLRSAVYCLRC